VLRVSRCGCEVLAGRQQVHHPLDEDGWGSGRRVTIGRLHQSSVVAESLSRQRVTPNRCSPRFWYPNLAKLPLINPCGLART
jgi:hypothetical protein